MIAAFDDRPFYQIAGLEKSAVATMAWPSAPGRWHEITCFGEMYQTFINYDDTRRVIISVGDGCTARAGWVWVSSQRRDDGLYEHVFRRDDGK